MPGKLPHDPLDHQVFHLTYRLAGSIPLGKIKAMKGERDLLLEQLARTVAQAPPRFRAEVDRAGRWEIQARYEMLTDQALHQTHSGPFHLQRPEIAKLVLDSWQYLHQRKEIFLWAVCIMGNHVHAVLSNATGKTEVPFGNIVKRHKNFTALHANRLLKRTGRPFWAETYFDRRIRSGKFLRVMWYVLENPVKAGLASRWQDWLGTWVHPDYLPMFSGVAA